MRTAMWRSGVAVISLAIWAGTALAQTPDTQALAARVNGEGITLAEVQAVLETRPSPVPVSKELERELRKAALDMLTEDLLMRQYLRRSAPPANPTDVQKEYDKLFEALKKQSKTFEQFLHEGKMTKEQFRDDVVARLQWKAFLAHRFGEAEVRKYYDANKLYFDNVVVRASHILVKMAPTATAEDKQKAREKLAAIQQEIVSGKVTFEEAARRWSECPSKDKGGDIGPFPYKFVVVEPLARAAFATKKGAMTDIVATEFGLHLVLVTNRTAGEPSQFEQIRDAIRDVMAQEQDLYQHILSDQRKSAKIDVLMP
jgi:parvulin-like peptidyl-prolyl isomerase